MAAGLSHAQTYRARTLITDVRSHGSRKLNRVLARASSMFGLFKGEEAPVRSCGLYSSLWARLKEQGLPDQYASLQSVGNKGRGLVAEGKINKGDDLLQIPFECALTSASALEGSPLLQRLNADEALDDWTILAIFLAQHRYLRRSTSSNAKSCGLTDQAVRAWASYVGVLPSRTGAVLEWSQEELDSVRKTCAAVTAAEVTTSTAAAWQQVAPMLEEASEAMGLDDGVVTEENFRWGVCILLSRLIRLQDRPRVEALVPWADFINHSPASNAYVRASSGISGQLDSLASGVAGLGDSIGGLLGQGGGDDPAVMARKRKEARGKATASLQGTLITLRADRAFPKGQEVVASYGQKSSGELLVSYGFVPPPGTNPHDVFKLTLRVSDDDPNAERKKKLLNECKLREQETFPIKWSGWPVALLPYAAFVFSRPEDPTDLPELARFFFNEGQFPGLDGVDTYDLARECVAAALDAAYSRLDIEADVKRAETIVLPSTIFPSAAVPVSEDGEEVEVSEEEVTTYVLGALAAVRQREKQIIGRTLRLLYEDE